MVTVVNSNPNITDGEEISIVGKVIDAAETQDESELYDFIDVLGNQFQLKIWENEADKYDIRIGNWYFFQEAVGDTYSEPMIGSNRGKMGATALGGVAPDSIPLSLPETTASDIADKEQISILGQITGGKAFADGNELYTVEGIDGTEFELKLWEEAAANYAPRAGSWYLFYNAEGDLYKGPQINSNGQKMIDIPLSTDPRDGHR